MADSDLDQMMKSVEEVLRCPICLETLQPTAKLCQNGHATCAQCVAASARCSLCAESYTQVPFLLLGQLMDVLPKPCKYSEEGCPAQYDLESHKYYCPFRPIKCRLGKNQLCGWNGLAKNWVCHAKESHNEFIANISVEEEEVLYYHDFQNWESNGYLHIIGGKYFLFAVRKDGDLLRQSVHHFPLHKPAYQFYYQITLFHEEETIVYRSTIKAELLGNKEQETKYEANVLLKDCKIEEPNGSVSIVVKMIKELL